MRSHDEFLMKLFAILSDRLFRDKGREDRQMIKARMIKVLLKSYNDEAFLSKWKRYNEVD